MWAHTAMRTQQVDFQEFVDLMTTGLRQMIEEALERVRTPS